MCFFSELYDPNWQAPAGVQRFKLSELSRATGGFDEAHEIGEGGFGKVFVGEFKDGRTLAIKRASGLVSSSQGMAEFRNEVISSLLNFSHGPFKKKKNT